VFARLADNNADRVRAIEGQATLLGRTMHGIAYDAAHDEIVVPQQFGQAILTFAGAAAGEARPLRVIQGSRTQLRSPQRLEVDSVHGEIFPPQDERVLVFRRDAEGNVAPVRVLKGPDTRIGDARAVAIDNKHDLLVVVSTPPKQRTAYEILIFDRGASRNAKPKRVISGLPGYGNVVIDPDRALIFVVLPPRVGIVEERTENVGYVGVWGLYDEGRVPPRYTIGNGVLIEPRGVTLDLDNQSVIVSDKQLNAILTFHAPELSGAPTQQQEFP
jgi:hypothetical protein